MILRTVMLLALVGSCKSQPPPIPTAHTIIEPCPVGFELPTVDDVCDGMFTADGLACVHCKVPQGGCFDNVDAVYCTAGVCTDDRRCARVSDGEDAPSSATKRRLERRK